MTTLVRAARSPADIDAIRELLRDYETEIGIDLGFQRFRCRADTIPGTEAAQALYTLFGFCDVPAYTHNPLPGARFMAAQLQTPSSIRSGS